MAHPDPQRHGSEQNQRRHVGTTSQSSDVGMQDKSQGKFGTASHERKTDDQVTAPSVAKPVRKSERDQLDKDDPAQVSQFATRHGTSAAAVREVIAKVGPKRVDVERTLAKRTADTSRP